MPEYRLERLSLIGWRAGSQEIMGWSAVTVTGVSDDDRELH